MNPDRFALYRAQNAAVRGWRASIHSGMMWRHPRLELSYLLTRGWAPKGTVLRLSETEESESYWLEKADGSWQPTVLLGPGEHDCGWLLHEVAHLNQGDDESLEEHSREWFAEFLRLARRYDRGLGWHLRRTMAPSYDHFDWSW